MNPDNLEEKRNPDGTFRAGVSGNPAGRPRGKSMKEYLAQKFRDMDDNAKEEWLKQHKVPGIDQMKMGEGNPKQDTTIELQENEPSAIRISE